MSGQFDTESGGTVGIYRKKDRYQLLVESEQGYNAVVQLTEDELYRLIYLASPDLRWLVGYAEYLAIDAGFEQISGEVRQDLRVISKTIPTDAEITKRRRAAQRRKRRDTGT